MSQSGKLVMIAALQIKQLVTECLLYFHVLGLWEIPAAALYVILCKKENWNENTKQMKSETQDKGTFYHRLLSYANVAVK